MSFYQQIAGQRRPNSAFTLFELIGVLAIISIILAMVAPMTLQMLKLQRQQADKAALPEIAQALKLAMLREQSFPSTSSWWDMVARHGAGSAYEIRYSDNQQSVERRLYFANSGFNGRTFFDIVKDSGASGQWLTNFDNPSELRLLILSTINPDLDLPNIVDLTAAQFNEIWSDWSNAPGEPTASDVSSFGLGAAWEGRAGELNIERIDLRDFLCQVAIDNACFANGFYDTHTNDLKEVFMLNEFNPEPNNVDCVRNSLQISTHNLAGAQVALNLTNPRTVDVTLNEGTVDEQITQYEVIQLEPVRVLNAGRIIDENDDAEIRIKSQVVVGGKLSFGEYVCLVYNKGDPSLRGPMKLKDPDKPDDSYNLGIHTLTSPYPDRYFFKGQSLLLETPWNGSAVGTVPITENQLTLRFDGLSWHY